METHYQSNQSETTSSPALQFDDIAFLYDELMAGVPYSQWVVYLEDLLKKHHSQPQAVLDLCCGTGSVSILLARKGYKVTGVDISSGMIECARNHAEEAEVDIDWYVQDAAALRIPKKFDLAISFFDSLNYILESSALQQVFYRLAEHLSPNALLIFDMNTELALASGLFNQSNLGSMKAPVIYNWRSSYDSSSRICRVHMSFVHRSGGNEKRVETIHYQRAYDQSDVEDMLRSAGLKVEAVYNSYTFRKPSSQSDRIFYVARK